MTRPSLAARSGMCLFGDSSSNSAMDSRSFWLDAGTLFILARRV
jgi:hypothetical protein